MQPSDNKFITIEKDGETVFSYSFMAHPGIISRRDSWIPFGIEREESSQGFKSIEKLEIRGYKNRKGEDFGEPIVIERSRTLAKRLVSTIEKSRDDIGAEAPASVYKAKTDDSEDGRRSRFSLDRGPTIKFTSLPLDIDKGLLWELCERFGVVKRVTIPRNRTTGETQPFGFVEYETEEMCKNAIAGLDGHKLLNTILSVIMNPPKGQRRF